MTSSEKFTSAAFAFSAGSALSAPQALLCFLLAVRAPDLDILSHFPGMLPRDLEHAKANRLCQTHVKALSEKYLGSTSDEQLEKLTPEITAIMTEVITDKTNKYSAKEKVAAAQWVWEQVKGKATQKSLEGDGVSLAQVLRSLDEMRTDREVAFAQPTSATAQKKQDTRSAAQKWADSLQKETQ